MNKVVNSLSDSVVRENWTFPFAIGIEATIEDCQYFSSDDAYLVKTFVDWKGPREGRVYQSRVKFILSTDGNWEFELLDANNNLKSHLVENAIPFEVVKGIGESLSEPTSYNIVCLNNGLDFDIEVYFRWGEAESWKTHTIKADGRSWFSNVVNESFNVRFDPRYYGDDPRKDYKYATIEPNQSENQSCDVPDTYSFWIDEEFQNIGLFKDPNK